MLTISASLCSWREKKLASRCISCLLGNALCGEESASDWTNRLFIKGCDWLVSGVVELDWLLLDSVVRLESFMKMTGSQKIVNK